MNAIDQEDQETPDALARRFLDSLHRGKVVEALDALAPDAILTAHPGEEHRGIREIAESLRPYRTPDRLSVDRVEAEGNEVSALVRLARSERKAQDRYRASIVVRRGRIASVKFSPA